MSYFFLQKVKEKLSFFSVPHVLDGAYSMVRFLNISFFLKLATLKLFELYKVE